MNYLLLSEIACVVCYGLWQVLFYLKKNFASRLIFSKLILYLIFYSAILVIDSLDLLRLANSVEIGNSNGNFLFLMKVMLIIIIIIIIV